MGYEILKPWMEGVLSQEDENTTIICVVQDSDKEMHEKFGIPGVIILQCPGQGIDDDKVVLYTAALLLARSAAGNCDGIATSAGSAQATTTQTPANAFTTRTAVYVISRDNYVDHWTSIDKGMLHVFCKVHQRSFPLSSDHFSLFKARAKVLTVTLVDEEARSRLVSRRSIRVQDGEEAYGPIQEVQETSVEGKILYPTNTPGEKESAISRCGSADCATTPRCMPIVCGSRLNTTGSTLPATGLTGSTKSTGSRTPSVIGYKLDNFDYSIPFFPATEQD